MLDHQSAQAGLLIPGHQPIEDIQRIVRLQGNGNYTIIYLSDQVKPLLVSQTLKYFDVRLPNFIRASKSFLINPAYISRVVEQNAKVMCLHLTDGETILVSRRRIDFIQARLVMQCAMFVNLRGHVKQTAGGKLRYYFFGPEN